MYDGDGGKNFRTMTIKAARTNADLTLEQASDELGISKATLCGYENGKVSPTIEMVLKMCELYKVGINQLNFLP